VKGRDQQSPTASDQRREGGTRRTIAGRTVTPGRKESRNVSVVRARGETGASSKSDLGGKTSNKAEGGNAPI